MSIIDRIAKWLKKPKRRQTPLRYMKSVKVKCPQCGRVSEGKISCVAGKHNYYYQCTAGRCLRWMAVELEITESEAS